MINTSPTRNGVTENDERQIAVVASNPYLVDIAPKRNRTNTVVLFPDLIFGLRLTSIWSPTN